MHFLIQIYESYPQHPQQPWLKSSNGNFNPLKEKILSLTSYLLKCFLIKYFDESSILSPECSLMNPHSALCACKDSSLSSSGLSPFISHTIWPTNLNHIDPSPLATFYLFDVLVKCWTHSCTKQEFIIKLLYIKCSNCPLTYHWVNSIVFCTL